MKIHNVDLINSNLKNVDIYKECVVTEDFWKIPSKIVTNTEYLSQPTEKVESLELGEKIAAKLIYTLNQINRKKKLGIGLTANQIGISASVFVIDIVEQKYFINPEIIEVSENKARYKENCLSLPNKTCLVQRHVRVKVKADNLKEPEWFGVEYDGNPIEEEKLLEAIVIQHEYNHTHGILITDLDETPQPIIVDKVYGRNELVKIKKDNEIKEIKYKKYDIYKKDGWDLISFSVIK